MDEIASPTPPSSPPDDARTLVRGLVAEFRRRYEREPRVFFAPGRANLIGAHLDYNGGAVLPVTLERGTYVAAAPSTNGLLRLTSLDLPGSVEFPIERVPKPGALEWAAYPVGVWLEGGRAGAFDFCVAGDLPRGSGLSSSASLEVASGLAFSTLFGWGMSELELAELGWRAETGFVGVKCGIMDQFACALGRENHALYLECSERVYRHVPLGGELELLVLDTKKPRELVDSDFNKRVEQCQSAAEQLERKHPGRGCLARFTPEEVEDARDELDEPIYRRARHVARESARVPRAVEALESGDFPTLGRLIRESHESSARDYEVSCPELDFLVDEVCRIDGVHGARLTGAGFGGCVLALQRPGALGAEDAEALMERYEKRFGEKPDLLHLRLGGGPRELAVG